MNQCTECGHLNRHGVYFCEECGKRLNTKQTNPTTIPTFTRAVAADEALGISPDVSSIPAPVDSTRSAVWGTAQLTHKSTVHLRFLHTDRILDLPISGKVVIGRADPSSASQPDIDLVPFGALQHGVSRLHASIELRYDSLIICDLGSSNGTYVNNLRLPPHQPHLLRDRDEIRFGMLAAYLVFN